MLYHTFGWFSPKSFIVSTKDHSLSSYSKYTHLELLKDETKYNSYMEAFNSGLIRWGIERYDNNLIIEFRKTPKTVRALKNLLKQLNDFVDFNKIRIDVVYSDSSRYDTKTFDYSNGKEAISKLEADMMEV